MRRLVLPITVFLLLGVSYAQNEAEVLFKNRCAHCHGFQGAGQTPAGKRMNIPDLRSPQVQKLSDEELFKTIYFGAGHHQYPHVFKSQGLTEAQVHMLVKYIRGLAGK